MYTLDQLVKEYLVEAGDTTQHRFPRILQIAISGVREMAMDVSGVHKTVLLDMNNDTLTANLPTDFLSYNFIGVCDRGGNLVSLGANDRMCLPKGFDNCGNATGSNTEDVSDTDFFLNDNQGSHWRNGELTGRFYGLGGGNNRHGGYRLDMENMTVSFQQVSSGISRTSQIWMEYLADPSVLTMDTVISPYDIEALKSWIFWKDIQRNATTTLGRIDRAKVEWMRNKGLAQRRHKSFTVDEFLQSVRKANKLSPKF